MPPALASSEVAVAVFQASEFTVVKLIRGNIEEVECDALVNSCPASMLLRKTQMGQGGVDIALRKAGGLQLEQEMADVSTTARFIRINATRPAVITSGGRMKGKRVIHVCVAPFNEKEEEDRKYQRVYSNIRHDEAKQIQSLADAYKAAFECAETAIPLVTSLALPCLGCGGLRFSPQLSANAAMRAIDPKKTPLATITFVCHNTATWTAFYQAAWTAFQGRVIVVPHPNSLKKPPSIDTVLPVLQLFTCLEKGKAKNPSHYCDHLDCWMLLPCLLHRQTNQAGSSSNSSGSSGSSSSSCSSSKGSSGTPRENIGEPSSKIFALHELLSSSDCKNLLKCFDRNLDYESVDWEYDHSYRDCERAVFKSPKLAEALFPAILRHMTVSDTADVRPFGFGNHGTWRPYAINDCFRLSRYGVGGHFAFHRDGSFVLNDDDRSVFTVLIYLNGAEEFKGGRTQIAVTGDAPAGWVSASKGTLSGLKKLFSFGKGKHAEQSKDRAPNASSEGSPLPLSSLLTGENLKTVDFIPTAGDVLIFPHDVLHAGEVLTSGSKFILRTDIMFHRVDAASLSDYKAYRTDPLFLECQRLYDESIILQGQGDPKGSTEAYVRATELQAQLASARAAVLASPMKQISADALIKALVLLSPQDVLRCAAVSKAFHHAARADPLWRSLMIRHFFSAQQAAEADTPRGLLSQSWYHSFKDRLKLERDFQIVIIAPGYSTTDYSMLGRHVALHPQNRGTWGEYEGDSLFSSNTLASAGTHTVSDGFSSLSTLKNSGRRRAPVTRGSIPSVMRKARGHYWSAFSGMKQYYVGYECFSSQMWFGAGAHSPLFDEEDGSPHSLLITTLLKWVPLFAFESIQEVAAHPLILVVPAWLCNDEGRAEMNECVAAAGFPRLWLVDQPVVLLRRADLDSGLVITFDKFSTVSVVSDRKTLSVHTALCLEDAPAVKQEAKKDSDEAKDATDALNVETWLQGGVLSREVVDSVVAIVKTLAPSLPPNSNILFWGNVSPESALSMRALLVQQVLSALSGNCGHIFWRLSEKLDALDGTEWLCAHPSVRESFALVTPPVAPGSGAGSGRGRFYEAANAADY